MKRLIATFLVLLGISAAAFAQERSFKNSVQLTIGTNALANSDYFSSTGDPYTLAGIYEPAYSGRDADPVLAVGAETILGRRFALSAELSWARMSAEAFDGVTRKSLGESSVNSFCFLPGAKFYWTNKERIKVYSGLYLGAEGALVNDLGEESFKLHFAADAVPIGIRIKFIDDFGLYALSDIIIGTRHSGWRFGLGFAF